MQMNIYLVIWKYSFHNKRIITICSSEEIAEGLGQAYCDNIYLSWLEDWKEKGSDPVYEPRNRPSYEIREVVLDQVGETFSEEAYLLD
jgi:hypothetical protein